jgi:hypothetical protein
MFTVFFPPFRLSIEKLSFPSKVCRIPVCDGSEYRSGIFRKRMEEDSVYADTGDLVDLSAGLSDSRAAKVIRTYKTPLRRATSSATKTISFVFSVYECFLSDIGKAAKRRGNWSCEQCSRCT